MSDEPTSTELKYPETYYIQLKGTDSLSRFPVVRRSIYHVLSQKYEKLEKENKKLKLSYDVVRNGFEGAKNHIEELKAELAQSNQFQNDFLNWRRFVKYFSRGDNKEAIVYFNLLESELKAELAKLKEEIKQNGWDSWGDDS